MNIFWDRPLPNIYPTPTAVEEESASSFDPDLLSGLADDGGLVGGGGSSSSIKFDLNDSNGSFPVETNNDSGSNEGDLLGAFLDTTKSEPAPPENTAAMPDLASTNNNANQGSGIGRNQWNVAGGGSIIGGIFGNGFTGGNGKKRSRRDRHHHAAVATGGTAPSLNVVKGKLSPTISDFNSKKGKAALSSSNLYDTRSARSIRDSSSSFVESCFGLPSPILKTCLDCGGDNHGIGDGSTSIGMHSNTIFGSNNNIKSSLLCSGKIKYGYDVGTSGGEGASAPSPMNKNSNTLHRPDPRSSSNSTASTTPPSLSSSSSSSRSSSPSAVGATGTIKLDNETLHAQELNGLTNAERERLYEQIHGVVTTTTTSSASTSNGTTVDGQMTRRKKSTFEHDREYDIQFQNDCLVKMEFELSKMRNRYEYNLAHFLAPSVVKDRTFRLMFLRAENYNPRTAARRIIKHFEYKATLWGNGKVATKITYDDLSDEDKSALHSGSMQVLPTKDTAGRTIFLFAPKFDQWVTWKNQLRALWYLLMTALENNPSLQVDGMVGIFYFTGYTIEDRKANSSDIPRHAYLIRDGIPFRVASLHWCLNDPRTAVIFNLFRTMAGKDYRLRFRHHIGSHIEVQYALLSFGIPRDTLPIDAFGDMDKSNFQHYVTELRQREIDDLAKLEQEEQERQLVPTLPCTNNKGGGNSRTSTKIKIAKNCDDDGRRVFIAVATNKDVLFGRGKPYQVHPGNIRLGELIEERQMEYNVANRQRKTDISWEIVQAIIDSGGRFMKKSNEDVASKSSKSKKKTKSKQPQKDNGNAGSSNSNNKCSKKRNGELNDEAVSSSSSVPVENDEDMWELVSFAIAREKVAHGFRTPNRGGTTSTTSTTDPSTNNNHSANTVDSASGGTGTQEGAVGMSKSKNKKLKTTTAI